MQRLITVNQRARGMFPQQPPQSAASAHRERILSPPLGCCYVNAKRSGSLSYGLLFVVCSLCVHVGAPVMFDDGVHSSRSVSLLLAMMDYRLNLSCTPVCRLNHVD